MLNIINNNFTWNGEFENGENIPQKIVLHNADASTCTVQDIHSWHLANGWAGIGYHYFIRKDGSIYRGRQEGWRGSHCPTANYNSIGICFEGKYMVETMPTAQFNAGKELIADIRSRHGNLPIYGHRELYSTDCPGINFPLQAFKDGTPNNQVNTQQPVTTAFKPNAVVVNDFLYARYKDGTIEPDRQVDIGDNIKVIDISYNSQLAYVEYPLNLGGTRRAYVKNCNLIKYLPSPTYIPVYRDVFDVFNGSKIGSVNEENVIVLEDLGDRLNIAYSTTRGQWSKSGIIYKW